MMKTKTKRGLQIAGLGLLTCATALLPIGCLMATRDSVQVSATSKGDAGSSMSLGGVYSSLAVTTGDITSNVYRPFRGVPLQQWTYSDPQAGVMMDIKEFQFVYWDSQGERPAGIRTGEYALVFQNYAYDELTASQFLNGFTYYNNFNATKYSWDFETDSCVLVLNETSSFQFIGSFRVYAGDYNTYAEQRFPSYMATDTTATPGDWQEGYNEGYDKGYRNGTLDKEKAYQKDMDNAYSRGKAYGESHGALSPTGTIGGLMLTIVSVPLTILNGFQPFAVYQIPLMSILMSFLFVALVIWIIRKLI